ncbi:MAG: hypothetical protein ACYS8X_13595 [Planctomycetota bacterium]|jgi:hypothetical protein
MSPDDKSKKQQNAFDALSAMAGGEDTPPASKPKPKPKPKPPAATPEPSGAIEPEPAPKPQPRPPQPAQTAEEPAQQKVEIPKAQPRPTKPPAQQPQVKPRPTAPPQAQAAPAPQPAAAKPGRVARAKARAVAAPPAAAAAPAAKPRSTRALAAARRKQAHLQKGIAFRSTMIPILLTMGILLLSLSASGLNMLPEKTNVIVEEEDTDNWDIEGGIMDSPVTRPLLLLAIPLGIIMLFGAGLFVFQVRNMTAETPEDEEPPTRR